MYLRGTRILGPPGHRVLLIVARLDEREDRTSRLPFASCQERANRVLARRTDLPDSVRKQAMSQNTSDARSAAQLNGLVTVAAAAYPRRGERLGFAGSNLDGTSAVSSEAGAMIAEDRAARVQVRGEREPPPFENGSSAEAGIEETQRTVTFSGNVATFDLGPGFYVSGYELYDDEGEVISSF